MPPEVMALDIETDCVPDAVVDALGDGRQQSDRGADIRTQEAVTGVQGTVTASVFRNTVSRSGDGTNGPPNRLRGC
jgi:hypothetical protein